MALMNWDMVPRAPWVGGKIAPVIHITRSCVLSRAFSSTVVEKSVDGNQNVGKESGRMNSAIRLREAVNYDISAPKLLEALTAASCQETFCYERLEHLGDAFLKWSVSTRLFLKYPDAKEGQLTEMRQQIVSNSALHKCALDKGLQNYIQVDQRFHPEISSKTLADIVEALVGVYYAEKGPQGARHLLNWLSVHTDDYTNSDIERARAGHYVSEDVLESINFKELERIMNYSFQAKNLLAEALTHRSARQAVMVPMYERLEFVGDAVLDYLLTRHIYFSYKNLAPGRSTDLRTAALNNENFARAIVKHKLHLHVMHQQKEFPSQIEAFVKYVAPRLDHPVLNPYGIGTIKAPRFLSDVLQSLAGAVFIDSDLDIDLVWKVFEPLLQPLVTPETVPIQPVRELYEWCQQNEKSLEWKYSTSEDMITAMAVVDNTELGRGTNIHKKMAKKLAAKNALVRLRFGEFSRQTLHTLCAQKSWSCPDYSKCDETGPDHAKMFTCVASLCNKEQGWQQQSVGQPMPTLNKAKDSAAFMLMNTLRTRNLL